jgi:UV DNA damage endonuclease
MSRLNLGYACINMTLGKLDITTNRTMRKKTLEARGMEYVNELTLKNVKDLQKIVEWNTSMGIKLFRISSDVFPWMGEYELNELESYLEICDIMGDIGRMATNAHQRLTMHPGHFNCLGSPNPKVVEKTIKELNQHSEQFDMMGFDPSPYNKINIHVGGTYGDKEKTLDRFCASFETLDKNTKCRLTVENDDKASGFSVKDLYEGIYKRVGIPIVFDYFHHKFNTGGLSEQEALDLANQTWPEGIIQCCHYSESRQEEKKDQKIKKTAHSDLIYSNIECYDKDLDIVVEAKHKELAVLNYGGPISYIEWLEIETSVFDGKEFNKSYPLKLEENE